jgi:hypothetical protein
VFPQNVSAVTAMKDALDNGQMVHARVLSGVGKHGTMSTATGAGDLPVTRCGDHAGGAHRYQVIRLAPA